LARYFSSAETSAPSALFVPGKYCHNVTPPVIPHFDLESLDVDQMKANLRARGRDLTEFPLLDDLPAAGAELRTLDRELETVGAKLTELRERRKQDAASVSDVDKEIKESRALEKQLTSRKWELEETCVDEYLRLPNRLHSDTPVAVTRVANNVLHQTGKFSGAKMRGLESHTSLCRDQLTFTDHGVYMEGDLAMLELEIGARAQDFLLERGLEMVAAPDMARSSIVEGCHPGCDPVGSGAAQVALPLAGNSDFGPHDSAMGVHLVGSASLYPFVGQLSKNMVTKRDLLPLRQFSVGRKYRLKRRKRPESLFNVTQTNCAQVFTASRDGRQMECQFEELVEGMREFYDAMDVPFSLGLKPAKLLNPEESKVVLVQVEAHPRPITVGMVSLYDDFVSKRLMLMSSGGEGNSHPCEALHIAAGTFVDATRLVGCLVENSPQQWRSKIQGFSY